MEKRGEVNCNGYEKLETIPDSPTNGNGHYNHQHHHHLYAAKQLNRDSHVSCYQVTVQHFPTEVRRQSPPPPKQIFIALITLIACFCIGTPLSLLCTLPAYILADRAEVLKAHGEISKAKRFTALSCILCLFAALLGIATIISSFIVYNYIVYPDEFH